MDANIRNILVAGCRVQGVDLTPTPRRSVAGSLPRARGCHPITVKVQEPDIGTYDYSRIKPVGASFIWQFSSERAEYE